MNMKELEVFLEDVIEKFNKQEEVFGKSFSLYGVGARAAYKHILEMIQSSNTKAKKSESE